MYQNSKKKKSGFSLLYIKVEGRVSSVGIATGYGLDGSGIEYRWGREFPYLSRPALGPTQFPVQWVPCLFRRHISFPLISSLQYLFDICLLLYVQSLTPDDGRKDRPKHVECYCNKINFRH